MKQVTKILAGALALLTAFPASAQLKDKMTDATYEYKGELGFFQKANRDLSDPIFMMKDKDNHVDFGIGGTVKVNAFYDFIGANMSENFIPASILVPNDNSSRFGSTVKNSELHAKIRYYFNDHKVTAFFKIGGKADKTVEIKQAYVSFDGLSIGLIPTFFTDLAVGYLTAGCNVASPVSNTHPLIGYKRKFNDHWVAGVSVERPYIKIPTWLTGASAPLGDSGLSPDNQAVPDVTLHGKYSWGTGHVQLGLLARTMRFWAYKTPLLTDIQGESHNEFGYGISLTGNNSFNSLFKLSAEFVYGKGISSYLDGISDFVSDLGVWQNSNDGIYKMGAVPIFSGLVAGEFNWNDHFRSTAILSYSNVFTVKGLCYPNVKIATFANTPQRMYSAIANFFWIISRQAHLGLECLYGYSKNRMCEGLPSDYGHMARVMASFSFMF